MNNLEAKNEPRGMMKDNYGENKMDKSTELNESMTINEGSRDSFESTLHNIGGSSND